MHSLVQALETLSNGAVPFVAVTVVAVRGSAPREVGAKMLVTAETTQGTIGGGQLEYQCAQLAFRKLHDDSADIERRKFALGANCGQCCGGVVEVMFERIGQQDTAWIAQLVTAYRNREPVVVLTPLQGAGARQLVTQSTQMVAGSDAGANRRHLELAKAMLAQPGAARLVDNVFMQAMRESCFHIAVFGAGHVGAATVDVLRRLDCKVRWIDSRRGIFPPGTADNVVMIETDNPDLEVAAMPEGSYFLVMTHSHSLDESICERVLRREDFNYCGLIGSTSKRRRFERRLHKKGISRGQLGQLTCPIGVAGINGRRPEEIAIATAAEIMQRYELAEQRGAKPNLQEVGI